MPTAIEFDNISKQYRLGLVSTRTLSHDLNRWWKMNVLRRDDPYLKIGEVNDRAHKGQSDYVWALKDINFKVEQGDVLGIIGKNGAGKSTLLKILSKVTAPTTGIIRARGRIASLLEVGTGFHPEMTGRENIYMNGAIMGMTKAEITRKLDEIIDFSGVERYIDTPVKRYSSGMTVRLGFAIAAHLDPEILVVDEVLAVGDAEFQKKAIGKMQDVSKGEGRTVLFVSHNMGAVKNLCKNAILLNDGIVSYSGRVLDVVNKYSGYGNQSDVYYPIKNIVKEIIAKQNLDKIELVLKYDGEKIIRQPNFGFVLYDNSDYPIYGTNPLKNGILDFGNPNSKGEVRVEISSPYLVNGTYSISVWFSDGIAHSEHLFHMDKCLKLEIVDMDTSFINKEPSLGVIIPKLKYYFTNT